jgi:Ca-activated chloride channel family protein
VKLPKQEGTVMLVIDVSGSMDARDVSPTRLSAAIAEAEHFVEQLPSRFQVGLVAFASSSQVRTPPTTDRVQLRTALEALRANGGTAMGDGIEQGLDFRRQAGAAQHGVQQAPSSPAARAGAGSAPASAVDGPPMTMILLSDGASNEGRVTPEAAAQDASQLHVPIYTISLGTQTGTLEVRTALGIRRIPVPPEPAVLQRVASMSGGRFFAAPSDQDLHSIYDNLATRIGFETQQQDITPLFVAAAAVLLLAGGGLATLWFHRFP